VGGLIWFGYMKTLLLSLVLSFPLFLNGDDKPIDYDRLEKREVNGEVLLFIVDSKNPFTGITTTSRYENGQKRSALGFKAGKMDGLSTRWYENGQKESETNFKEDKPDGVHLYYDETGKETMRSSYFQGILKSVLKSP
jgi:antitoxin component YwqK of YwqJK toxin-antitoxin module